MTGHFDEAAAAATLPVLRRRHLALLKAWQASGDKPIEGAHALREYGSAAGAWIEDAAERDAAQSIVDYWTATIAGQPDQPYPDLKRLEPFDPANGELVERQAEEAFLEWSADRPEAQARSLFLDLAAEKRETVANQEPPPPWPGDVPVSDEVIAHFTAAGVIGPSPDGAGPAIVHRSLLIARWPRLRQWLAERRREEATLDVLITQAQGWDHYERKRPHDLLSGAALDHARQYADRDPLLRAFVDASSARSRQQLLRMIGAGAIVTALIVILFIVSNINTAKNAAQDAARATEAEVIAETIDSPAKSPAPIAHQVEAGIRGEEGFIWIGNARTPLLAASGAPRTLVKPDAVEDKGRYQARVNIAFREGAPDDTTYVSKPRIGLVSPGAEVVALGKPKPYDRPSGIQYWLKVRRIPRVYIQYRNGTPAEAERLQRQLVAAGYLVPPVDLEEGSYANQVRYFRNTDINLAKQLARDLAQMSGQRADPAGVVGCRRISGGPSVPSGQLEIWIDLDTVEIGEFDQAMATAAVDCRA